MPIRFHGGKKLSFMGLVRRLMAKGKSREEAEQLAGWIEKHGPGAYHAPNVRMKR